MWLGADAIVVVYDRTPALIGRADAIGMIVTS